MISLSNLCFSYGRSAPVFQAVQMQLDEPGFYGIMGESGCGKSTLGKIIAGLLTAPDHSMRCVEGRVLLASCDDKLPHWLPVGRHLRGLSGVDEEVLNAFLEVAALPRDLEARTPGKLSLGQRQRFNLARYIAQGPDILVLDEPLAGVDQPSRWRILSWIKAHRQRRYTLLISHEIEEVAVLSREILRIGPRGTSEIRRLPGLDRPNCFDAHQEVEYARLRTSLLAA
jgi:ABC-type multidrug transport system ATPase subunit